MTNPSNQTNPLDYPKYVRGIRPALPQSLGDYVDTELEKVQNSMENMAVAADQNTKTQVATLQAGTNKIFYQSTAPVATADVPLIDGDLWYDTSDNNHPYIYSGGAWVDNTDGRITANAAAITDEQTVRANEDQTLASDISTLTTTVNGNTATIQTNQQSINGLEAKYGVSLNVNGYITGFQQNNDGTSGSFIITADNFAIVDPGAAPGDPGTTPFQVTGGQVLIENALIDNLTVNKLAGGVLDTGATPITQNSDINLGTGHIVFDNGVVQLVEGVGFGSTGQFIQWFGPKQTSFANCTEANATFYLKIDGSAYFGGTLSAGTIYNSAQTTDTSASASIEIGPFSSNGNSISATCSYSYDHHFNCDVGTGGYSGTGSATIVFEASTNSGAQWTTLATLTCDITGQVISDPGNQDTVKISGGTSTTVTWNPGVSTTLELRGRMTAFSSPTGTGTNQRNNSITQNITVSSTEQ